MVAVPEAQTSAPTAEVGAARHSLLAHCRRVVAIVDNTAELLRPESDLLRIVSGIGEIDVLVAVDDAPVSSPGPVGLIAPERAVRPGLDLVTSDVDEYEDGDAFRAEMREEDGDAFRAEMREEIERLGLPGLRLHHLGLPAPLSPLAEPDLVAALSELVGFDPEPGVYCLAPAPAVTDVHRSALTSAARRIAQVYGLPLLRYRCLELAVVPEQRESAEG
jgi:hypothetical protein